MDYNPIENETAIYWLDEAEAAQGLELIFTA
jgi:hypothetical protein